MLLSITESIKSFFLETVGRELCVFFCSMIPIIELRGAIPIGAALKMSPLATYLISVAGNMLPVPFILLFIKAIIKLMQKSKFFSKFANWLVAKAEKNKEKISKYGFWGVALFVMIPLPGTGAWTGALVASLLDMRLKRALPAIAMGVAVAGLIVLLVTYGVISAGSLI